MTDYSYEAPTKREYKQAAVGVDTGILYMFADVGTHEKSDPVTSEKRMVRCVYLGFELPNQKTDDGQKNLSIVKEYTLSFHEKASLRKAYLALAGLTVAPDKFSPANLLGAGANLNIGRTSGGNAKIEGIFPLKANEQVPPLTVDPIFFDLRNPDNDALSRLPGFLKDKVLDSPEYKAYILNQGKSIDETLNDTIPF